MRLSASAAEAMTGDLLCDNYRICREKLPEQGTEAQTVARARAAGWHIYDGETIIGIPVRYILGPACVGQRGRLPKAPEHLPGQEELF